MLSAVDGLRRRIRIALVSSTVIIGAGLAIAACGGSGGTTDSSSSSSSTAPDSSDEAPSSETATSVEASSPAWEFPNGDLSNTRDAQGSQIDSSNVAELGVAWTSPIHGRSTFGSFAANPVVHEGVVYMQDLESNVEALNLETGAVEWTHKFELPGGGPNGVAYDEGKIFGLTTKSAFALDAKTGKLLWETSSFFKPGTGKSFLETGIGIDMQPVAAEGVVYVATAGLPGGGVHAALDEETGKVLWKWTDADPSEPKVVDEITNGGSWNTPAVSDDGIFYGIGNGYFSPEQAIKSASPRKWNDSVVKLDRSTGKFVWGYQGIKDDIYDWDMNLSPILTSTPEGREIVLDSGKMGIVYAVDESSGKLIWKTQVGTHNGHDEDSAKILAGKPAPKPPYTLLPGSLGGTETNMAVAEETVYVPAINVPSTVKTLKSPQFSYELEKGTGELEALDLATGKVEWKHRFKSPELGAATVSNDLVFTTLLDGTLVALNRSDGSLAWQTKLPAGSNAPIAIVGDTLVTGAGFPQGAGQSAEYVAYKLGATGSAAPKSETPPKSNPSAGGEGESASSGGTAAEGKTLFTTNCASCHTLADAGTTGTVGPDLDELEPSEALVQKQVTDGGGGMPSFGGQLSVPEIETIATYVSSVAGKPTKTKPGAGGGAAP